MSDRTATSGSTTLRVVDADQVHRHNFRRLGYDRLTRGIYERSPDLSGLDAHQIRRLHFMARVKAVVEVYGTARVALFGPTALQVLGVALPTSLEDWDNCHLQVRSGTGRPRRTGVVPHRTNHFEPTSIVNGLPLLHPVDHWVQLHTATVDELVEVGDGLLRRQSPLLSPDDMRRRMGEIAGTGGITRARAALRLVVPGTDSLYETRTRVIMVRAGLPTPEVNLPVAVQSAGTVYHVDMGYRVERIGVEFDGAVHVGNRRQMEIDAMRRRHLQDDGWLIITVTATQLAAPGPFLRSIEQALILRRSVRAWL